VVEEDPGCCLAFLAGRQIDGASGEQPLQGDGVQVVARLRRRGVEVVVDPGRLRWQVPLLSRSCS
jgi:hypothetical protein